MKTQRNHKVMSRRPTSSTENLITTLYENDVLSGRGTGPNEYSGNRRFRDVVDDYRNEYAAADSHEEKRKVAERVVDEIGRSNGRFLTRVDKADSFVIEDGVWKEMDRDAAVEKCKQALRQKRTKKAKAKGHNLHNETSATSADPVAAGVISSSNVTSLSFGYPAVMPFAYPSVLMLPLELGSGMAPNVAARLMLYQSGGPLHPASGYSRGMMSPETYSPSSGIQKFTPRIFGTIPPETRSTVRRRATPPFYTESNCLQHSSQDTLPIPDNLQLEPVLDTVSSTSNTRVTNKPLRNDESTDQEQAVAVLPPPENSLWEEDSFQWASNDEVSNFLIASLGWDANHPRFTEEEFQQELDSRTDIEKASILADLFGKFCSIKEPQNKKPKKDLSQESLAFLIRQTRGEIERIPNDKKLALLEAEQKARTDEFSDERLLQFLRCEGMHPKLAAERLANYWAARVELFGPDKCFLRLTLSEALRDDVAALRSGVYALLPQLDLSGRPLLYMNPSRNNGIGFTAESLLRAIWYTVEVAATHCKCGQFVFISNHEGSTVWDYDRKLFTKLPYYEKSCFPIKAAASHACCAPSAIIRTIGSILSALLDSRSRARIVFHDNKDELIERLSEYGIEKEMLPVELGGTIDLDANGWISQRRSVEMEWID
jgi:hypothetical protein